MKKLAYIAAIAVAVGVLAGLPSVARADLTFDDAFDLGSVIPGEPASDAQEVIYVNNLVGLAQGSGTTVIDGHTYNRKNTSCGTCPTVTVGDIAVKDETGNNVVDLGTGGFTYLLAKYDGPNGGDEIWNVQGMTGLMEIPLNGLPPGNKYGLSHFTLFGGGGQVPDGGTTAALLGAALAGMGFLRRYIKR
jgi:hypothetical protein